MDSDKFVYWLQGFFELAEVNGPVQLSDKQIQMIRDHLNLCFTKVTPSHHIPQPTLPESVFAPGTINPSTRTFC